MQKSLIVLLLFLPIWLGCAVATPAPVAEPRTSTLPPTHTREPRATNTATLPPELATARAHSQTTATVEALLTAQAPSPTPTLPAESPRMIVEGVSLNMAHWSPDAQWIAYWRGSRDAYPSVPEFYEVETGRICAHPDYVGGIEPEYSDTYLFWLPDNRVEILADGAPFVGAPCSEFEPAQPEMSISPWTWAYSPDGRYRAQSEYDEASRQVTTTITNTANGTVLNRVKWLFGYGQRPGLGGDWLGSERFLLPATADQGPLMIEVGRDAPIEVMPDRFGILPTRPDLSELAAYGAVDETTGNYHLLLLRGVSNPRLPVLLYHSETATVETLPFRYITGLSENGRYISGFSPNGSWLMLLMPIEEARDDYQTIWMRPVDGSDSDIQSLGAKVYTLWSGPTNLIAYKEYLPDGSPDADILIASFPEGRVLSHWADDEMIITPYVWSPDGTKLLAHGFVPQATFDNWREAIFVIEP